MRTPAGRPPAFRPESDLVVLARDHLDALVRVLADGDETASEDLHALGLSGDPTTIGPARSLAAAWARSSATVVVTRAGGGVRRAVEVRWGPAGVVALPVAPAYEPVAVAVSPPTALVACLWRLLRLGPRRRHDRTSPALDATNLTAPFDDGIDGGWTRALGVEGAAAVLSRLELREHRAAEPLVLGLVDDGTALWDVAAEHGRWRPGWADRMNRYARATTIKDAGGKAKWAGRALPFVGAGALQVHHDWGDESLTVGDNIARTSAAVAIEGGSAAGGAAIGAGIGTLVAPGVGTVIGGVVGGVLGGEAGSHVLDNVQGGVDRFGGWLDARFEDVADLGAGALDTMADVGGTIGDAAGSVGSALGDAAGSVGNVAGAAAESVGGWFGD